MNLNDLRQINARPSPIMIGGLVAGTAAAAGVVVVAASADLKTSYDRNSKGH